jgi:rRNA maturation endonuclease Nob1
MGILGGYKENVAWSAPKAQVFCRNLIFSSPQAFVIFHLTKLVLFMKRKLKRTPSIVLFALVGTISSTFAAGKIAPKEDPAAKALAALLKPLGLTSKAEPSGLGAVKGQISAALSAMEASEVTGGPGSDELLSTAYTRYRPDVGPVQRVAAVATLSAMWREARALGCFNDQHKFTGKITRGPDTDKDCTFEYIVPLSTAPEFSKEVTNIRLVAPSKARSQDGQKDPREEAKAATLVAVAREIKGKQSVAKIAEHVKTNAVGQTPAEAAKIFKQKAEEDGDAVKLKPSIILSGTMSSTPSKQNGRAWHVNAEVHNLSNHATEIEFEITIIGSMHKTRANYVMSQQKKKLQLRSGQLERLTFQTAKEGTYKAFTDKYEGLSKPERAKSVAHYRGAVFRVRFGTDVVAKFGTDDALLPLLTPMSSKNLESLPKL